MKSMDEEPLFRKGTFELHPDADFDFRMNRLVM